MPITRPRGRVTNTERRQKPLHPHHKSAQEKALTDGTFPVKKADPTTPGPQDPKATSDSKPVTPASAPTPTPSPEPSAAPATPVPSTPPNNITAPTSQTNPAGTSGGLAQAGGAAPIPTKT